MHPRKKILWLVSWYPNKYNLFDGDFIQRHAKAAAIHHDIHVLFIKQFHEQKTKEETVIENNGLTEQIIFLPAKKGCAGKFQNFIVWQSCYKKTIRALVAGKRLSLIHVHVPWKVGLVALWAKKRFDLPYAVTEHWDIYNRIVDDNIYTRSVFFRYGFRRIYRGALHLMSVSRFLANEIKKLAPSLAVSIVPNVVDTELFQPRIQKHQRFTFVHVSNMAAKKNVEGLLQAFAEFKKQKKNNAQLILVGKTNHRVERLAEQLHFVNTDVFFAGEIEHARVAEQLQNAHVLVMNSNIENSPCVIGEALCCGLPVIATSVGGVPELINAANGLLVPPGDTNLLAQALRDTHQNYLRFDAAGIALAAAEKFGVEAIAAAFSSLYRSR